MDIFLHEDILWQIFYFCLLCCWFANEPPKTEDKKRLRKKAYHSKLVSGRYNKQGNSHKGLAFEQPQDNLYSHPPNLQKVYMEVFTRFSHIYHPGVLSNTLSSQRLCLCRENPSVKNIPRMANVWRTSNCPSPALRSPAILFFQPPPPTLVIPNVTSV